MKKFLIDSSIVETQELLSKLIIKEQENKNIEKFIQILRQAKTKNRIWLAGNGGSASTASHFASDLMRLGFDVYCMTDNISRLTALTNDYSWEQVYFQQLVRFKENDVLILVSVHGGTKIRSNNLVKVAIATKNMKGKILSLLGSDGGNLKNFSDVSIIVPSNSCCLVEGVHSVLTHIICKCLKGKLE